MPFNPTALQATVPPARLANHLDAKNFNARARHATHTPAGSTASIARASSATEHRNMRVSNPRRFHGIGLVSFGNFQGQDVFSSAHLAVMIADLPSHRRVPSCHSGGTACRWQPQRAESGRVATLISMFDRWGCLEKHALELDAWAQRSNQFCHRPGCLECTSHRLDCPATDDPRPSLQPRDSTSLEIASGSEYGSRM